MSAAEKPPTPISEREELYGLWVEINEQADREDSAFDRAVAFARILAARQGEAQTMHEAADSALKVQQDTDARLAAERPEAQTPPADEKPDSSPSEPRPLTLAEARKSYVLGWNIRCNLCGSYGAAWIEDGRPRWGSLAACLYHKGKYNEEVERHRAAMLAIRTINFEQERVSL